MQPNHHYIMFNLSYPNTYQNNFNHILDTKPLFILGTNSRESLLILVNDFFQHDTIVESLLKRNDQNNKIQSFMTDTILMNENNNNNNNNRHDQKFNIVNINISSQYKNLVIDANSDTFKIFVDYIMFGKDKLIFMDYQNQNQDSIISKWYDVEKNVDSLYCFGSCLMLKDRIKSYIHQKYHQLYLNNDILIKKIPFYNSISTSNKTQSFIPNDEIWLYDVKF